VSILFRKSLSFSYSPIGAFFAKLCAVTSNSARRFEISLESLSNFSDMSVLIFCSSTRFLTNVCSRSLTSVTGFFTVFFLEVDDFLFFFGMLS